MASVTQDLLFKQSVMKYAQKHGVTYAAVFYKRTRQWIYYWLKRYDGSVISLAERSRRPKSHPRQHTEQELKLIINTRRRVPKEGLVDFWVRLRRKNYSRTIPSLYRVMRRLNYFSDKKHKKPKYVPKPYERMVYPGQRVQIDVKFVPKECCKGLPEGERLYQFTAIDEYSRVRYLEGFSDNSSYSAAQFVKHAAATFKFKIECVQTDNGQEFVKWGKNRRKPTLFQEELQRLGIRHKLIRPFTPRHNGKVERSHRKDQERFYDRYCFFSLSDYNKQLRLYNNQYNDFPTRPLNWLSPNQFLANVFSSTVINV